MCTTYIPSELKCTCDMKKFHVVVRGSLDLLWLVLWFQYSRTVVVWLRVARWEGNILHAQVLISSSGTIYMRRCTCPCPYFCFCGTWRMKIVIYAVLGHDSHFRELAKSSVAAQQWCHQDVGMIPPRFEYARPPSKSKLAQFRLRKISRAFNLSTLTIFVWYEFSRSTNHFWSNL